MHHQKSSHQNDRTTIKSGSLSQSNSYTHMTSLMTRRKRDKNNNNDVLYSQLEVDDHSTNQHQPTVFLKKRKKKRRSRRSNGVDESFLMTYVKVSSAIAILCILGYVFYSIVSLGWTRLILGSNNNNVGLDSKDLWSQYVTDENDDGNTNGDVSQDGKSKAFPIFDHNDETINAFTIAIPIMKESKDGDGHSKNVLISERDPNKKAIINSLQKIENLKEEFALLYGGENAAKEILKRGIITFKPSQSTDMGGIHNTAKRIFNARTDKKSFKVSFAGSSAVAGFGNYFKQSFPSVLVDLFTDPLKNIGVELEVRNAAVADIASFPYGWCLNNFMGEEADVISWDSSLMDRADTDAAFEAYLRRAVTMKTSPMLIIREGTYSESRRKILQKYVDLGALIDPIIINVNAAAEPFLDLHEDVIPTGFQDWLEFGAPEGAPGKVRSGRTTRLSKKQHQLVAWLITMHFATAIELGAAHVLGIDPNHSMHGDWLKGELISNNVILPKPQADYVDLDSSLMLGRPIDMKLGTNSSEWRMDDIHCATTFEPIVSGDLKEMVISGSSSEDLDLMLPRGPMSYMRDWVMDLGIQAKQNKFSFQKFNFDYRYEKKAYYGVKPSGNLTIFIPYKESKGVTPFQQNKRPSESLTNLVLCEVNEHYGEKQCNMQDSMGYLVGGISAKASYIEANGASYQGKKNCVQIDIPPNAKWTTRNKMESQVKKKSLREKLFKRHDEHGLSLSIAVVDQFVFWNSGPCSISHVIWEQRIN